MDKNDAAEKKRGFAAAYIALAGAYRGLAVGQSGIRIYRHAMDSACTKLRDLLGERSAERLEFFEMEMHSLVNVGGGYQWQEDEVWSSDSFVELWRYDSEMKLIFLANLIDVEFVQDVTDLIVETGLLMLDSKLWTLNSAVSIMEMLRQSPSPNALPYISAVLDKIDNDWYCTDIGYPIEALLIEIGSPGAYAIALSHESHPVDRIREHMASVLHRLSRVKST